MVVVCGWVSGERMDTEMEGKQSGMDMPTCYIECACNPCKDKTSFALLLLQQDLVELTAQLERLSLSLLQIA